MAKSAEVSLMNVSALRLADRQVVGIVDTATHVAIYQFNPQTYEWEKNNAEGALFVYSRSGDPKYSIIVLNRLNTSNLVEPITESIDLQLQEPFLLYKNSNGEIHGVWFYDKEECARIAKTIAKLVSELSSNAYKNSTNPQVRPIELMRHQQSDAGDEDGTPKSVKDFFARAGSKGQPPGQGPRAPPGMPSLSMDKQIIPPGVSPGKQLAEVNPLLQRLMSNSNPPITVEQLEKQQRSSPQDIPKSKSKSSLKKETTPRRPLTLPVQGSPQIENGMNFLYLSESPPQGMTPSSIPTQHFFNSAAAAALSHSPPEPLEVSVLEQALETPTKPALIPPVMFASSKEEVIPLVVKPEPLTKSQLLQAVTYLLKNDADFINKLHEAYVKSFVDMVS